MKCRTTISATRRRSSLDARRRAAAEKDSKGTLYERPLDDDWLRLVQRRLNVNCERRESRRDFEAFLANLGRQGRSAYWAAVCRASPAINFENICNGDQYLLLKAILDMTATSHGPFMGTTSARPSKPLRT